MFRFLLVSTAAVVFTSPLLAQDHAHQPARQIGTVHFETSCTRAASPVFDTAVAWLHSFEFAEAIAGFKRTLSIDPGCAMAHWGIAVSTWTNPMSVARRSEALLVRGQTAIAGARAATSSRTTQREKDYIAAAGELFANFANVSHANRVSAYERAMSSLATRYPDDTEAAIFHAISLVAAASPSDKTYTNQRRAGAILESLWVKQPDHPGLAHYIIHTYDYPALAADASTAAQRYASIAPAAAHALHMPSHIFTRTGRWRESIETNAKSRAHAERTGSIAEALHALDYATYAYLQRQQHREVKQIIDELPSLESRFDVNAITGAATGSAGVFALAAIPTRYALERDAWEEAASLKPRRSDFRWADAITFFGRALGSARSGRPLDARGSIDSLASIATTLARENEPYWSEQVAIQHLVASAWVDLAQGRVDSALSRMRQAALREDATEKSAITPGPLAPARELLADMLLQLDRPAEALIEYRRALTKEPNRFRALSGGIRAAQAAGDGRAEAELKASLDAIRKSL